MGTPPTTPWRSWRASLSSKWWEMYHLACIMSTTSRLSMLRATSGDYGDWMNESCTMSSSFSTTCTMRYAPGGLLTIVRKLLAISALTNGQGACSMRWTSSANAHGFPPCNALCWSNIPVMSCSITGLWQRYMVFFVDVQFSMGIGSMWRWRSLATPFRSPAGMAWIIRPDNRSGTLQKLLDKFWW